MADDRELSWNDQILQEVRRSMLMIMGQAAKDHAEVMAALRPAETEDVP